MNEKSIYHRVQDQEEMSRIRELREELSQLGEQPEPTLQDGVTKATQFIWERPAIEAAQSPVVMARKIAEPINQLNDDVEWWSNREHPTQYEAKMLGEDLADIVLGVFRMAGRYQVNLSEAVRLKIEEYEEKYPKENYQEVKPTYKQSWEHHMKRKSLDPTK
jgi:NTP pyrophosphatase (non-canonical NTP hydrolase)